MARIYTSITDTVGVASAADLWEIAPATGKAISIHRAMISQHTSESSEQLVVAILIVTSAGAGGTTLSASPHDPAAAACSAIVKGNNSALASGSIVKMWQRGDNVLNGWDYDPTREEMFVVKNPNLAVIRLVNAPSASLTLTCDTVYEEQ